MNFILCTLVAVVAAVVGAALAFLYTDRKSKTSINDLRTQKALADQRLETLTREAADTETLRRQIAEAHTARAVAEQQASSLARQLQESRRAHEQAAIHFQSESNAAKSQFTDMSARLATAAAELAASQNNIAEQRKLLDDANEKLTQSFAAVSRDALEKSNAAFLQMAEAKFKALSTEAAGTLDERKAQIGTLLKPLEEMLGTYQKRLAEMETQRTGAYAELRQQIGVMSATQSALSTQTTQLVSALTRPNVRGQWGEIALRKLVELAGMSDRCDFVEQTTTTDLDGNKLRPDMVVHLPADRQVVIDCKAVLGAFLDASAAPDEPARHAHMLRHSGLIRARAKDLSTKAYWQQFHNTPEFVVLFLPGEAFLYAACEHDATLLEDAIAAKVIIATPTTLIALLKSIEYGWRQQAVSENAEAIRKLGSEIYDRLATLADYMVRLGKSLDGAVDTYNKAVGTLESRVLVSARKISELGAGATKEIPDTPQIDKRARELASILHPEKSPLLPD